MAQWERYRRNPEVSWRTIEGQAVLVLNREGEIQVLNAVGTLVWEHIGEVPSAIAGRIASEYDVSPEEALEDVFAFLEEMRSAGTIVAAGG